MGHRRSGRSAVPMLLAGGEPDDIAWPDFLPRATLALRPAAAICDDERLAQRVCVPSGARARLKCDDDTADTRGVAALEARVHPHRPGEVLGRSLVRRLRTSSSDLHFVSPLIATQSMR